MIRPRRLCGGTRCSGYTWIELLVVVVVLAVLLAVGVPLLLRAREALRRAACTNNLKQIGVGIHNYATATRLFRRAPSADGPVMRRISTTCGARRREPGKAIIGTQLQPGSGHLPVGEGHGKLAERC